MIVAFAHDTFGVKGGL